LSRDAEFGVCFVEYDRRQGASMKKDDAATGSRKEYFPPKVVHTEKIEARAVACAKDDDFTCGAGPLQS